MGYLKRIFAGLLVAALLLSVFCGCENVGDAPDFSDPNLDITQYHDIWQYQYYLQRLTDDAINDAVIAYISSDGEEVAAFQQFSKDLTAFSGLFNGYFKKEDGAAETASYLETLANAFSVFSQPVDKNTEQFFLNRIAVVKSIVAEMPECSQITYDARVFSSFVASQTPHLLFLSQTSPETDENTMVITFGGNTFLGNKQNDWQSGFNAAYAANKENPYYPFLYCLPYFLHDDLTLVTYEGNLTNASGGKDDGYNGLFEYANLMARCGIDGVALNTEHNDDFLAAGLEETDRVFENAGIHSYYDQKSIMINTKMGKLALISYNIVSTTPSLDSIIRLDIEAANKNGAKIIIVNFHWGKADSTDIASVQEKYAKVASNMGADLIIGSHPHLVQGIAYTDLGRGIFYSLGDLCHGADTENTFRKAALVQITIKKTADGFDFTNFEVIPLIREEAFVPIPAKGKSAKDIIDQINTSGRLLKSGVTVQWDE